MSRRWFITATPSGRATPVPGKFHEGWHVHVPKSSWSQHDSKFTRVNPFFTTWLFPSKHLNSLLYLFFVELICSFPHFLTGWWFGTLLLFSFSWECHHPNWLMFFRGVGIPPTSVGWWFVPGSHQYLGEYHNPWESPGKKHCYFSPNPWDTHGTPNTIHYNPL